MREKILFILFLVNIFCEVQCYKIIFLLPYSGRSHHEFFSPLIEELAARNHDITVVNYLPFNNSTNLKQIYLQDKSEVASCRRVDMGDYYKEFPVFLRDVFRLTDNVSAQKEMASNNCHKIFSNSKILKLIESGETFDVFIIEQFYSDCGLAWAKKIRAPIIGITAHILMPWTYSRLGLPNNPAYVPSRIGQSGLWARIKSVIVDTYWKINFHFIMQRNDLAIASEVLPNTPDLEEIASNMSLILINQYFPLTGSRLQGSNVVEIGGMHIKMKGIHDGELQSFLDSAENGVIVISFGSVASNLPEEKVKVIMNLITSSSQSFVWKVDEFFPFEASDNLILREWLPQVDVLCHKNVKGFISHSGMLSSIEAMHCGVPVVSIPVFGDQLANAQSLRDNGLGVTLDFFDFDTRSLNESLEMILEERFQTRAELLSNIWQDRPSSPMESAIFWINYVARYKGAPHLKPATVNLPLYQYLMLDVWLILCVFFLMLFCFFKNALLICLKYNC